MGDNDEVVGDEDDRDVCVSQDFIFLEVPGTRHAEVVDFHDRNYGAERSWAFRTAIAADNLKELSKTHPPRVISQDPDVTRVVFVIHGIRDMGQWTLEVARELEHEYSEFPGNEGGKLQPIKPSYRYFALAPFLDLRRSPTQRPLVHG